MRAPYINELMLMPMRTIQRWLRQLKDEGKIEYRGSPKTRGYFVL